MGNSTIPRLFESINAFPLPVSANHYGNTQIQDNSPLILYYGITYGVIIMYITMATPSISR